LEKPILRKRKIVPAPVLRKRKNIPPIRRCQNIIDDGFYTGKEKICSRLVRPPNKFLCQVCLRSIQSESQILGYEL